MDAPDSAGTGLIELRIMKVAQIFHTLDPTPFRDGDLAEEAERYILEWAAELPPRSPITVRVHLPESEAATPAAQGLPAAVQQYFARRAEGEVRLIRENFRSGRRALVIGLAILAGCLGLAVMVVPESGGGLARIAQESLVILGWVALWRPCEIFLYDWLPMARRRDLFRRLARAQVSIIGDPPLAAPR